MEASIKQVFIDFLGEAVAATLNGESIPDAEIDESVKVVLTLIRLKFGRRLYQDMIESECP